SSTMRIALQTVKYSCSIQTRKHRRRYTQYELSTTYIQKYVDNVTITWITLVQLCTTGGKQIQKQRGYITIRCILSVLLFIGKRLFDPGTIHIIFADAILTEYDFPVFSEFIVGVPVDERNTRLLVKFIHQGTNPFSGRHEADLKLILIHIGIHRIPFHVPMYFRPLISIRHAEFNQVFIVFLAQVNTLLSNKDLFLLLHSRL